MTAKQELYFDSRDNVSRIHAVRWIPEEEVKCVLILVHGMAEHIERYEELASFMTERGILVAGNNHLGHGKSTGDSGKQGYFCEMDAATVLVRDVHRLKKRIQKEYPGVPHYILGHSMGSYIVRNYLCRYGTGVEGAILVGTGMPPKNLMVFSRKIAGLLASVNGSNSDGSFLGKLAFYGYNKKISRRKTAFDWLSVNEENVRAYLEDPMCGFTFTVNGFQALFELIFRIQQPDYLQNMAKKLPILLISGKEDPVGDYGRGVRLAEESLKEAGVEDVTVSLYDNARHEILNEAMREAIYEDIFQWIVKNYNEAKAGHGLEQNEA